MDLVDHIKLLTENKRLTALLIAIIDHYGEVTLTREEAEKVAPDNMNLKSTSNPDGSVTLRLEPRR